ncbi:MAG: PAS domain S-box protein [Thermodesulfobacteriota bacterium]
MEGLVPSGSSKSSAQDGEFFSRADRLYRCAFQAMREILTGEEIPGAVERALAELGRSSCATSVYLLEGSPPDNPVLRAKWEQDQASHPDSSGRKAAPAPAELAACLAALFASESGAGRIVFQAAGELPEPLPGLLSAVGVAQVTIIPVVARERPWGAGVLFFTEPCGPWSAEEAGHQRLILACAAGAWAGDRRTREILESGEKYRLAVENANEGVVIAQDGELKLFNRRLLSFTGYTAEEFSSQPFVNFIHPEDRDMVATRHLKRLMGEDVPETYPYRIVVKDGSVKWISANSALISWQGRPATLNFLSDITERVEMEKELERHRETLEEMVAERTAQLRETNLELVRQIRERERTEAALKASEEKYRSIMESIEEGYYEQDLAGNFTFYNASICRMFGYSSDEMKGMSYRQYMSPETAERMREVFNRMYRTRVSVQNYEYQSIRKDGRIIVVECSGSLILDRDGEPTGFRGFVKEVTERHRIAEEKRKLEQELIQARKMEAIGTLAGGVAHDFNNLLMGLSGNLSLMLLETSPDDPGRERLHHMEEYVKSAAGLTRQLLGFARSGKYEVRTIDLNEMVLRTLEMFGRTRKELLIETELRAALSVEGDRGQLEQVLLNLFVNAWQAMGGGGRILVRTADEWGPLPVPELPAIPFVKISVTDTGIGMDEATQSKVFDPFFTTKQKTRGTGLGLASAYGIVKNHGGAITLASRPGQGSTFNVFLPASTKNPIREAPSRPVLCRGNETVLLVDDESVVLETGCEMLKALGYSVLSANRPKEALRLFEKEQDRITLVVLDMIMPGMSGSELFDRMKKIKPDARVLLASGYSLEGEASDIMERGCDGFIQKPFSLAELSRKIREIIEK